MSRQMSMFEPGDKLCTISGEDNVYVWVVNERAMVVEHDVRARRIEEAMGIEPKAPSNDTRASAGEVRLRLLYTVYGLLGDGDGTGWLDTPEYTRALLDLVKDMFDLNNHQASENLLRQTNEETS